MCVKVDVCLIRFFKTVMFYKGCAPDFLNALSSTKSAKQVTVTYCMVASPPRPLFFFKIMFNFNMKGQGKHLHKALLINVN